MNTFEVQFPDGNGNFLSFVEDKDGVYVGVHQRVAHAQGAEAKPFDLSAVMPPHEVTRLIRFLKRSIGE